MYASYRSGLFEEYDKYKQKFSCQNFSPEKYKNGTLIFIWQTAVGPLEDDETADFEISGNNGFGKLFNCKTNEKHRFESACEINLWSNESDWTTLPRGIFYARIPLKEDTNEFEFQLNNPNGYIEKVPIVIEGNGLTKIRIFNSFLSESLKVVTE